MERCRVNKFQLTGPDTAKLCGLQDSHVVCGTNRSPSAAKRVQNIGNDSLHRACCQMKALRDKADGNEDSYANSPVCDGWTRTSDLPVSCT